MTAKILRSLKRNLTSSILVEIKIYQIDDARYPNDVKYSIVCIDKNTGEKVLFDNHHPKGHHYHINNKEYVYKFVNVEKLLSDFQQEIEKHFDIKL